jgi:Receptor family ligand binding region
MKGLSLVFLIYLAVQCAAIYEFSYFDDLRKTRNSSASLSASNPKMLWTALDDDGQSFNLGLFSIFMPFTDGSSFRGASQDEITAIIMAIYHFNNPELSLHLDPLILSDCSIKFTSNFYDTKYSPINTTRLFTKVLQEPNEFQNPHPAGVIGAYRSAVTSPLAILTGVNGIPQVSFASTSTDFDVKDQYPLFGRTIPSSVGEATMLLGLFQAFHASHIGILFVTDAFGSALQKAFQDAASEESIVTDSVAFSYSRVPCRCLRASL